jgi:hypothetical protein
MTKTKAFSRRIRAPELCAPPRRKKIRFRQSRGKRSAERRMPIHVRCRKRVRGLRHSSAPRPRVACWRRAAFRRSRLRHSPSAVTPMAQPQNRVSRRRTERECFARSAALPSVKHAPCGPVFVPVDRGPGAARERMANPRAGTAARFRLSGLPSGKAPSVKRGGCYVTGPRTIVKSCPRNEDTSLARSRRGRRFGPNAF